MFTFYDPQGKKISKEEFLKFYGDCYYLNNSKVSEEAIEKLLNIDQLSAEDVMLIIRWELGRIDHKKSQNLNEIVFRGNEYGFFTQTERGRTVDARELCEIIATNYTHWKNSEDYQGILNKMRENSPDNIGTVYLLTLLYFITQGKCPIYDRFAMMAARAISGDGAGLDKKPGDVVEYKDLPAKNEAGFNNLINGDKSKYKEFVRNLQQIFGDEYKKNRDIDRALWVYGHCFRDKES